MKTVERNLSKNQPDFRGVLTLLSGSDEHATLHRIEKFNGENFYIQKFELQMILEDKDLWDIVNGFEVKPCVEDSTESQRKQFQRRERKALSTICLSLKDEQLSIV